MRRCRECGIREESPYSVAYPCRARLSEDCSLWCRGHHSSETGETDLSWANRFAHANAAALSVSGSISRGTASAKKARPVRHIQNGSRGRVDFVSYCMDSPSPLLTSETPGVPRWLLRWLVVQSRSQHNGCRKWCRPPRGIAWHSPETKSVPRQTRGVYSPCTLSGEARDCDSQPKSSRTRQLFHSRLQVQAQYRVGAACPSARPGPSFVTERWS